MIWGFCMRYEENTLTDNNGKEILMSFYSTVPGGRRIYREHHHTECELSTIVSGSGTYSVNGNEYMFCAGDVFLFKGDEVHCMTDVRNDVLLLNIKFSPCFLWSDTDAFAALRIIFSRNENFTNKIDQTNSHTVLLHENIIKLHNEMNEKKDGYALMVKYMLFSMLLTLVRDYDYVDQTQEYSSLEKTVRPMEAALEYIDNNLGERITLEKIAKKATMSPTYFSAVFKKMNGLSPWEYITIKRVEMATELLKNSETTILDIAHQCGFATSSNFYKAFSAITGKKPSYFTKKKKQGFVS